MVFLDFSLNFYEISLDSIFFIFLELILFFEIYLGMQFKLLFFVDLEI